MSSEYESDRCYVFGLKHHETAHWHSTRPEMVKDAVIQIGPGCSFVSRCGHLIAFQERAGANEDFVARTFSGRPGGATLERKILAN